MAEGLLIFAAKQVGLELTTYVVERGDPIRHVVVGTDADDAILTLAARHGIPACVYDAQLQQRLVREGDRFVWLLNFWSPHILRAPTLALADRRLNVHPSLLPHCRGNDNAAWTLRRTLPSGVSLVEMSEGVDAGGVYAQEPIEAPFPITGRNLHERLQRHLIELFKTHWPSICTHPSEPAPQAGQATTFRRRDTEADRVLDADHTLSLGSFVRWALAHDFSPGTTAEMRNGGKRYRVRLHVEEVTPDA